MTYQLLRELEKSKYLSTKSAPFIQVTTKYKKRCQMMQSLNKKKSNQLDRSYETQYLRLD